MKVKERRYQAGQVIFVEGDMSNDAYLVKSGRIDIVRRHRGERRVLQHLQAGDIFGEMGLMLENIRTADAVVMEDCVCYVIDHAELNRQLAESPRFVQGLVRVLSDRLKRMNDKMFD